MSAESLQKAAFLLDRRMFDKAEAELRLILAEDPGCPVAHRLLALTLAAQDKFEPAEKAAREAVGLEPGCRSHHALGLVLLHRHKLQDAEASLREAVQGDPSDVESHSTLATVLFARERWQEALDEANAGLALDAEDVDCANTRAMSLIKLGRGSEAADTLGDTLQKAPEDAFAHATKGWLLLEQRKRDDAMRHFKEALRLEPSSDYARAGIVEALKARHTTYALFLRYMLWMAKLGTKARFAFIIGLWIGMQVLDGVARQAPAIEPAIRIIGYVYVAFVLITWLGVPLFNLALMLDKFGRLSLTKADQWLAIAVGAVLGAAGLLFGAWTAGWEAGSAFGILTLLWVLPVAAIGQCSAGWPRRLMILYTLALAATLVLAVVAPVVPVKTHFNIFLWGCVLSGFVSNFLSVARPTR